jgi:hypothetical protein
MTWPQETVRLYDGNHWRCAEWTGWAVPPELKALVNRNSRYVYRLMIGVQQPVELPPGESPYDLVCSALWRYDQAQRGAAKVPRPGTV